jgi:hypothetical protein
MTTIPRYKIETLQIMLQGALKGLDHYEKTTKEMSAFAQGSLYGRKDELSKVLELVNEILGGNEK